MEVNKVCWLCLSSGNLICDLIQINLNTKNVLAKMFNVHVDENSPICAECVVFVNKVLQFAERAVTSVAHIRQLIVLNRNNSVSLEPSGGGSDSCLKPKFDLVEPHTESPTSKVLEESKPVISEHENFSNHSSNKVRSPTPNADDDKLWFCNFCNKATLESKFIHSKTVHKDLTKEERTKLQTRCNLCEKIFQRPNVLYIHKKTEHPELSKEFPKNGVKCNVCDREFTSRTTVFNHKKKMHSKLFTSVEREYAPVYKEGVGWICCDRKFSSKTTLYTHKSFEHRNAIRPKPNICPICDKICRNRSEFKNHKKDEHNDLTKQQKRQLRKNCRQCGKEFEDNKSARQHRIKCLQKRDRETKLND